MDFITYTAITITMWVLSLSCLLPFVIVLKFSKKYRDMWFSWCFVRIVGAMVGAAMERVRKRAFDFLKERLPERKRNAPLEILEIGFGGGFNLKYYPENSHLTALDMNESFVKYFEENRQKNPQVALKKIVIAMAEDMHEIDDDSFDIVVCTYVLCSVKSVRSALKEVKRVLKPGGRFLFVEHIKYPSFTWKAALQSLTNPFWDIYFDGCNITRNHDEEMRTAGFSHIETEICYPKDIWLYCRRVVIGVATK